MTSWCVFFGRLVHPARAADWAERAARPASCQVRHTHTHTHTQSNTHTTLKTKNIYFWKKILFCVFFLMCVCVCVCVCVQWSSMCRLVWLRRRRGWRAHLLPGWRHRLAGAHWARVGAGPDPRANRHISPELHRGGRAAAAAGLIAGGNGKSIVNRKHHDWKHRWDNRLLFSGLSEQTEHDQTFYQNSDELKIAADESLDFKSKI